MKTINVKTTPITPTIGNWKESFDKTKGLLPALPQVISGSVKLADASKWLEQASKVHPQIALFKLINQVKSFGAKDIRALLATDRNEYFPKDSAQEVFQRKRLETIPAPNTAEYEKEKLLCKVARTLLVKRYNLDRDTKSERQMSAPDNAKISWLSGQPGMVATIDGTRHLFDIQVSLDPEELKESDKIGPHYYDLVASNHNVSIDHISVAKIYLDKRMTENLIELASLSKSSSDAVNTIIENMDSLSKEKLNLSVHTIEKQPLLYKEITETGKKYWADLTAGITPAVKQDPQLQLPENKKDDYTAKAKEFLTATMIRRTAEENENAARRDFVSVVKGFDISDNFSPPYNGALLRKYDHFDADGAAKYMETNFSVPASRLRSGEINTEHLAQAYKSMGGNPNQFYEYHGADKDKILNTAEELNIDLSGFKERSMRAIVSPKTRGPIFDAINAIKDKIQPELNNLNAQISSSTVMENKNLTTSATQNEFVATNRPGMSV